MTSCARTFPMKSNSLKNSRARPKSSKLTRSFETPKPTVSSPSQTASVTSWCPTRESLILSLSKTIPTDTKPDAKPVLSAIGRHTTRPVKRSRKRVASHLEKKPFTRMSSAPSKTCPIGCCSKTTDKTCQNCFEP